MSTLVITGNGFDIWHKLPTKYKYFHKKYNRSLELYTQYFDDFCDKDKEWENFGIDTYCKGVEKQKYY